MVLISHDLAANIFWCQSQSIYIATRTDLPIQAFTAGQLPGLILTRWKLLFFLHDLLNSVYRKSGDQLWYKLLSTSLFICLFVVSLWTADFYFRSLWNILMIQHIFVDKRSWQCVTDKNCNSCFHIFWLSLFWCFFVCGQLMNFGP